MNIEKEREVFEKEMLDTGYVIGNISAFWDEKNQNYDIAITELRMAWCAWKAAKAQAVPEGFVVVPKDNFESLNEFKDLYKRAIINARKRKDQLNWAHVAGLGVGSGRAVELCKILNIDPSASNMHEVIEAQEQSYG